MFQELKETMIKEVNCDDNDISHQIENTSKQKNAKKNQMTNLGD